VVASRAHAIYGERMATTSRAAPPSRPASFCDLDDSVINIRDRCGFHCSTRRARKTKDQRCTQTDYPRLHARFFLILSRNQITPGCKTFSIRQLSQKCAASAEFLNKLCRRMRIATHFYRCRNKPAAQCRAEWALIAQTLTNLEVYFVILRLLSVRPDLCLDPAGAVNSSPWTRPIIALPLHLRYRTTETMTITAESKHATAC
jgi:hypothetical protein